MKCYVLLLLCECSISGQFVYLESLNYAGKSPGVTLEIFSMGNSDAELTSLAMTFSTETTTGNSSCGFTCASQRSISPAEHQSFAMAVAQTLKLMGHSLICSINIICLLCVTHFARHWGYKAGQDQTCSYPPGADSL